MKHLKELYCPIINIMLNEEMNLEMEIDFKEVKKYYTIIE